MMETYQRWNFSHYRRWYLILSVMVITLGKDGVYQSIEDGIIQYHRRWYHNLSFVVSHLSKDAILALVTSISSKLHPPLRPLSQRLRIYKPLNLTFSNQKDVGDIRARSGDTRS